MKGGIVVCGTLLVFFLIGVNTSPLAIDQKKDDKPLSVVDVPAGLFEPSEDKENPVTEAKDEAKDVVETVTTANEKEKDVEQVEEGPSMFGFKFPSVVIIRRPSIFQDPFPFAQSPFFSSFGFNRRPSFPPPGPMGGVDRNGENERDREPLSGAGTQQQSTLGRQNDTIIVKDVIQRMHQQINNLFANLFNPDAFQMPAMPRPSFPRPFFSRPSFFGPLSGDSSELDEDVMDPEKLPDNYTNSTSETKVVDGQLVTVNKTVHRISGNNSNGFFQFSVIKVGPSAPKPTETPINIAQPSTPDTVNKVEVKKPVEDMDPSLNEVERVDDANQEKLSEVEINNKYEVENDENAFKPGQPQPLVQEEEVRIVPFKSAKLIQVPNPDLASDIRINNLMANSEQGRLRALVVPDEVEIFDV